MGANASEFATQKKLQDYAERIGDHLWEGTPAFAKRQQLLSPDQYEIVDVRTSRGMRRAMLFPKAILQAEFYSEQYLRASEAEAMCDHVWIFEARTLSTKSCSAIPRPIGSGRSLWRICRACAPGYRRRRSCVGGARRHKDTEVLVRLWRLLGAHDHHRAPIRAGSGRRLSALDRGHGALPAGRN